MFYTHILRSLFSFCQFTSFNTSALPLLNYDPVYVNYLLPPLLPVKIQNAQINGYSVS
jgi:hypothetical protein